MNYSHPHVVAELELTYRICMEQALPQRTSSLSQVQYITDTSSSCWLESGVGLPGPPFSLSLFSPACVSPTPSVPLGASRLDTCHQPPYHGRQSQRLPKKDQYASASKRHSRFRCSLFPIPGRFCLLCASMLVCSSSPKPDIMPPSPSCWNLHVLHSLDPRNLSLPYRHRPCTASPSPRT